MIAGGCNHCGRARFENRGADESTPKIQYRESNTEFSRQVMFCHYNFTHGILPAENAMCDSKILLRDFLLSEGCRRFFNAHLTAPYLSPNSI